jgi:hypothetical protein
MTIARSKRLSPRIARIRGVRVAEITAARCECGRPVEPSDFELIAETQLRAICAGCHTGSFEVERTWCEAAHD